MNKSIQFLEISIFKFFYNDFQEKVHQWELMTFNEIYTPIFWSFNNLKGFNL